MVKQKLAFLQRYKDKQAIFFRLPVTETATIAQDSNLEEPKQRDIATTCSELLVVYMHHLLQMNVNTVPAAVP
eukprot:11313495-Ditylum_brightwellii.AAC.1